MLGITGMLAQEVATGYTVMGTATSGEPLGGAATTAAAATAGYDQAAAAAAAAAASKAAAAAAAAAVSVGEAASGAAT